MKKQLLWTGVIALSLLAPDAGASSLSDWAKGVKDKTVAAARDAASAPLDAIKGASASPAAPSSNTAAQTQAGTAIDVDSIPVQGPK